MNPLDLLAGAVGFAALAHFGGISLLLARARSRFPAIERRPPVTILRFARGIENHIEETLESAFGLDYPEYEIVFCVQEENDPIIPVIRRMMARHPEIASRLLIGDDRISINPKLNNTVKGWHAARYDWIVMADSNVLMPPDYLDRLLERWLPGTGLVCSPPVGSRPEDAGADLECAFLNTYQARWQLIADVLGTAFAQGKTMLWRREYLEEAGGIDALAVEPAEDAASTKLMRKAGRAIHLVIRPFPQPLGRRPFRDVWQRQLRWARLRRSSFPAVFVPEAIAGGLLPLAAAAILAVMGVIPLAAFLGLFAAWYAAEALLAWRYDWPLSSRIVAFMVMRDLMLLPLWISGWGVSTFVWRGNAMDMKTVERQPLRPLVDRWRASRVVRSARQFAAGRRSLANLGRGNRASRGG